MAENSNLTRAQKRVLTLMRRGWLCQSYKTPHSVVLFGSSDYFIIRLKTILGLDEMGYLSPVPHATYVDWVLKKQVPQ